MEMLDYRIHNGLIDRLRIGLNRLRNEVILLDRRESGSRADGTPWAELRLVVDFERSEDEIFSALRNRYLEWRHKVGVAARACEVLGRRAENKSDTGRQKLARLCERWNTDSELTALEAISVVMVVEVGEFMSPWIGFTSSVTPGLRSEHVATMRPFVFHEEYNVRSAEVMAQFAAHASEAKARISSQTESYKREMAERSSNPAPLPAGIAGEIADYLRREFGESGWHPKSLKSWQLKFVGEYVIDGVHTQYWSFPSTGEQLWATVERFSDGYNLGMTGDAPPDLPGAGGAA